ncbi:MAG: excinuclease ABC subunit UvrA [Gammaproteobacteria bacterium]|nr:excinuclease ABC subunit UvrA [Gammaproteobacteria bacterium]
MDTITIQGARTHNLKNIDLELPRDKLIVITGLSGSGKSSLAFDTIYAEGQRRYVESLSSYARQFLSMMEKPDIDHIEGLSPAISIEQKSTSHNPRSTVGTVTEIYDYLRLLFARAGNPRCPEHHTALDAQTVSQMVDRTLSLPEGSKLMLLAPVVQSRKGEHHVLFNELKAQGYIRARIDGKIFELDDAPELELRKKHTIEVVVDRFKVRADLKQRLADSFETTLELSDGIARVSYMDDPQQHDLTFSAKFSCPECGYSLTELEPRLFSFNNPAGACPSCDGLGVKQFFDPQKVVHNSELSLTSGAIRGWDRRNAYYFQMLTSLAEHYGFDIEIAFEKLPKKIQKIILYGNEGEAINFVYVNDKGRKTTRNAPFEGVIHNMQRRYHETDSNVVREDLSKYQTIQPCPECHGSRLNLSARHVFIKGKTLPEITAMSIGDTLTFFDHLKLPGKRGEIAKKIVIEITQRLNFLVNVGLEYLTLERSAETLSGGEAQRIRLASQIGAGLVGVMYILDEPSIGLHQRDNQRLLNTLTYLRDLGNTVIVVEHDEEAIRSADYIVDIGPGAGVHGGEIVAQGKVSEILNNKQSITAQFLNGTDAIKVPEQRTAIDKTRLLEIKGATGNNLKNVSVSIPVGLLTVVTGVSGSGKSTLINDTLYRYAAGVLNRANTSPAPFKAIAGLDHFDKVIDIDQSPIGRTPRSNPATYTGLFTSIRDLFAATNEARSRGYAPGRFSFNVKGGRCEACQGDGVIKVEMHFLPDIYVPCDVCRSKRYNRETLEIKYKGKNIYQILDMTIEDAHEFFTAIPALKRKLQTLLDVGLSYIKLGQSATTLSGGEAQRVKLSRELSKRDTGKTLYILDEPTTGLHFYDIKQLLQVLFKLRDHGNTVVIIEHNLDVIKTADWLIDMGPEGGNKGGTVIDSTTPEQLIKNKNSYTGDYLKPYLQD